MQKISKLSEITPTAIQQNSPLPLPLEIDSKLFFGQRDEQGTLL
jgi:hypothetical protein